jgi:hypothetical protein
MVGHLLGISDRHQNNLLIDTASGEVLHIDFGMVFEQGRLLPVPELVPFRLTRETVAGFGAAGFRGGFLGAAEEAAATLRAGAPALLTALSVILHDPL